jgi:hypothetical protein
LAAISDIVIWNVAPSVSRLVLTANYTYSDIQHYKLYFSPHNVGYRCFHIKINCNIFPTQLSIGLPNWSMSCPLWDRPWNCTRIVVSLCTSKGCYLPLLDYCHRDYWTTATGTTGLLPSGYRGTFRLLWGFSVFFSVVRQMPGYNSQRRGTARTSQFFFIVMYVPFCVFCVLFCVNVYCTTATGCQTNCNQISWKSFHFFRTQQHGYIHGQTDNMIISKII